MALSQVVKVSLAVSFFGALAFILGVIAENKKVSDLEFLEANSPSPNLDFKLRSLPNVRQTNANVLFRFL